MSQKNNNQNRVRKPKGPKEYRSFSQAYANLRGQEKAPLQKAIIDYLGISQEMFYLMKRGERPLSKVQILFIESAFKEYGIDAWTGEILTESNV